MPDRDCTFQRALTQVHWVAFNHHSMWAGLSASLTECSGPEHNKPATFL